MRIAVLRALLAMLVVPVLLSGCDPRERWILGSPTFYPTALDFWPESRAFLVGSYHDGSIQRVALDGSPALEPFQEKHADGRQKALRLKVDRVRNRLWVLDIDAVYVYALPENRLIRRIVLPRSMPSREQCLPDIALDSSTGAAYISDNRQSTIYMISEEAREESLERTDIPVRIEGGGAHRGGFSALVVMDDPFALIAGSASTGRLWRIDPATGKGWEIAAPALKGICGLSTLGPEERPYRYGPRPQSPIYAATAFHNQVVRILVSPDLRRGDLARVAPHMPVQVPTSMVAFRSHIVVTASQLDHHGDFGGDREPLLPFRLVLMPSQLSR